MEDNKLFNEAICNNTITHRNFYKDFFKATFKKTSFIIPFLIISLIFIVGFIMCNFTEFANIKDINLELSFSSPSLKYPFGLNEFGQNQLYLVLICSYKTLLLAFIVTLINTTIGIFIGIAWGSSKNFSRVMFIVKNVLDNVPLIFFYIIVISLLGSGFISLLIAFILFGWIEMATITRNNLTIIKSKDYNKISQLYDVSLFKRAINNYLPAILPILFNNIALCVPQIIALEMSISYFGFSIGENSTNLGTLIYSSISNNTCIKYPHLFIIPFLFLFIINTCIYLISKTISTNFIKEEI